MHHTEVDDLGAVILHHENVAWLQVPVDQSSLVRGLQSPAHMHRDLHDALHGQARAGVSDQVSQRGAAQQRHHEEWFFLTVFLDDIDVPNFHDIRVGDLSQGSPFLGEQIDRHRIGHILHELDGDGTAGLDIEGAPDHTHAAFTELSLEFVPPRDKRRRHKLFTGTHFVPGTSLQLWGEKTAIRFRDPGTVQPMNHCFLGARLKGSGEYSEHEQYTPRDSRAP